MLSRQQKQVINSSSRAKVEEFLTSSHRSISRGKWINKQNRYRLNCISRYDKDDRAATVNAPHMIGYISASAATHVIDGWSFLGRAVDALLRGDAYSATHFGYYAELRAAMGLLASEGIGIFNRRHPTIDDARNISPFRGASTHADIWPILRHWGTLRRSQDLLEDIVRPNSIRLSDWFYAARIVTPIRAVAQHWLQLWGIDLGVIDDDRDCRNLASYRPSEFRKPSPLTAHELTAFVEELWHLFEPGIERRFPNLERYLLRTIFRKSRGTIPAGADLENLGLSPAESTEWIAFLQQPNDPSPFLWAEQWVPVDNPTCHIRIISRAALLLYMASASARRQLLNAGFTLGDFRFWWAGHGENHAIWNVGTVPADPQDSWADIEQAIIDSAEWRARTPAPTASLRNWRLNRPEALADLGGFELAGIWALMP